MEQFFITKEVTVDNLTVFEKRVVSTEKVVILHILLLREYVRYHPNDVGIICKLNRLCHGRKYCSQKSVIDDANAIISTYRKYYKVHVKDLLKEAKALYHFDRSIGIVRN